MTAVDRSGAAPAADTDDTAAVQEKWQAYWDKHDTFRAADAGGDDDRPRRYVVDMFPYPSGDLHMGHAEAFAIGDVIARYRFQRGDNVLHPIGWDSFGLPAENAAIKRDAHPADWTYANIDTQAASFKRYGISFDWSRRLHTSDPDYFRWNQWLFLRFFERGLAYRGGGLVNWCPTDQTVLANEQVVAGRCERCGSEVVRRSLTQWYYRITEYADRLLDDMAQLEGGWPEEILLMQRNWIGRSQGADVHFAVEGREEPVTVFTTRPDTLYGATFFVVAADAPLADELCAPECRDAFDAYRAQVARLSDIERQSTEREKTGVFLGRYAVNPVNGERIPVWAADYVLADYGHGAIMAVPAHDQRDLDFARTFDLPVRVVVDTGQPDPAETGTATSGDGVLVNSGPLDGLAKAEAIERIIQVLAERGTGSGAVNYRLRDWLLSRQRFWGTPIPIVHCEGCGEVPVPDDQLPVTLPDLRGADLAPKGISPLAAATDWVNTSCPRCGGPALRDTDTMDTFVDSSWYFLRYCSPRYDDGPFDVEAVRRWGPVDQYVGGKEHATGHLLYSRFFTKVLYDMGLVDFTEPFKRLLNQGQVILNGSAMSKSTGNLVDLGAEIDDYGVDAVRLCMLFAGPPEDDIDWADVSPAASVRFLNRALRVMTEAGAASAPGTDPGTGDLELRKVTHRTIHQITQLLEVNRFNVAIARIMELVTAARRVIDSGPGAADPAVREAAETIAVTLSLFAPYVAEEGWERLGHAPSVAIGNWRAADPALLVQETVTAVVQVAGKVRDRLEVGPEISAAELERLALASAKVSAHLGGVPPRKVIVRAPKLVNIVPG
ncbi:leucine--tRNA ligase [Allonocardiopsis opalescens]|uniref:Leucine--tRNA ligase n=1 Tax=Allonocardiopsis opalescens TaxID=1144618 RepID=A0A2T0Q0R6_9ACTN|nr:leucine--tRNA ligase [Allonocardiopsis opalescens]PRX97374.1 leucyl-tRNA synthetase [Allonocardiopsis opalescens]